MPLTSWDVPEITTLLLEAGRIARAYYEDSSPVLKEDRTIVTKADKEIEAELAAHFDAPKAGVYLIGEETNEDRGEDYVQGALSGRTWVVDPIDGTSPYSHHLPHWGVSIGLMQDGRLVEGAIFLPATGEVAVTEGEDVLFGNLGCEPERWDPGAVKPLAYTPVTNPGRGIVSIAQELAKRGRFTGDYTVHAVGSCVSSAIAMLTGSFVGYIANIKLWDIGAAVPLFRNFGFSMKLADGTPYDGAVDEASFHLTPGYPDRWRMRTHLFVGRTEEVCDDILAHTRF